MTFHTVPINITSDGDFEETEDFSVTLSVQDFGLKLNTERSINLRQHVCKDKGLFSISSNGFSAPSYSVNECEGLVSIIIAILNGSLKRKVAVHLSTSDLTANGKLK